MHSPGQGKGLVITVTGATPDRVRMGLVRRRASVWRE